MYVPQSGLCTRSHSKYTYAHNINKILNYNYLRRCRGGSAVRRGAAYANANLYSKDIFLRTLSHGYNNFSYNVSCMAAASDPLNFRFNARRTHTQTESRAGALKTD